jgi:L-rhamnonate dehydratase
MTQPRLARIEWALLEGQRPRIAGSNARLGEHGASLRLPVARLTDDDGVSGAGYARITRDAAEAIIGLPLREAFADGVGVAESFLPAAGLGDWSTLEYPLWDLEAKRRSLPVYALAAAISGVEAPAAPRVRCYDTSLYIDDLHLRADDEAAALIATEAREGYARGHRAFKVKIGRGARHMPLEAGTQRDIAVIRAVREAVGPDALLMVDANNGYTLNLAKHVLAATADCRLFWLEEPFHEDPVLLRDLRDWLSREGLGVLLADGEGDSSPSLLEWAREGFVDVVQYDILRPGFNRWLRIGRQLDAWGTRSAPHHYGGFFGNFVSGHLAGAVQNLVAVEWDEATLPAFDTSRYHVEHGWVTLPDAPGFGLEIDEARFARAVAESGFTVPR